MVKKSDKNICPVMSKVVPVERMTPSGPMVVTHKLHEVECKGPECEMWSEQWNKCSYTLAGEEMMALSVHIRSGSPVFTKVI